MRAEKSSGAAAAGGYLDHLANVVERFPDRVAFRLKTPGGYRQLTYAEVHGKARAVAAALRSLGLEAGERAAIISENRPEWVVSYLGILMAGGTAVPLDPQISPADWRRLLDDSESKVVFTSGLHHAKLEALAGAALAERIIVFDPSERIPAADFESFQRDFASSAYQPAARRPDDVAVIIYTSGTTGKPKGVMLTDGNITSEVRAVLQSVHADHNDTFLCLLPLQHVFASIVNFLLPLHIGAEVVFADTLKRAEILQALEEAGITILATVPQFFYLFHGRIDEELRKKPAIVRRVFRLLLAVNGAALGVGLNLGKVLFGKVHRTFGTRLRLFVSGGSAFDPKVAAEFHDFGFTILQGYGLTETTGAATVTRVEQNVIGSVGQALPGVELRILDPDPSGIGEIAIRGPVIMKGYYRNPQATAEVLRDGWLHSGDLGRLDARGNLFITGRKKEVIVLPTGKNIYPDELETHYVQSPTIQEIAIVGIADDPEHRTSERLHAVVVPNFDYFKERKIANTREIVRDEMARLSGQLPKYARVTSFEIQKDPLPRTTTRKIKRLELRQRIEQGGGAERAPEPAAAPAPSSPEDAWLRETPAGQAVLASLAEHGRRDVDLDGNLEIDLGFDSMERVELVSSLEQALGLALPEDLGAEVHTVRDLIARIEEISKAPAAKATGGRKSWREILSEEEIARSSEWQVRFSGEALTLLKWLLLRVVLLVFRIFFGLEVRGREHLPPRPPYLICPNHQSYFDPFVVIALLPYRAFRRVFFVGYSEYFKHALMKLVARLTNIVPVDPDAHLMGAMKVGAYGLHRGRILCIFPEGSRSYDGSTLEFKKGAAILSREVGAPMVPVGLSGFYEAWPRQARMFRLHKLKIVFGAPIPPAPEEGEAAYEAGTRRLQEAVARLVDVRTDGR